MQDSKPTNEALRPHSVARIIKKRAVEAKLDFDIVAKLSGHSLRVGGAQDMAAAGISMPAIMHAGGCKSAEMVVRYIEHTDVKVRDGATVLDVDQRRTCG
jgi:hypothetical protein